MGDELGGAATGGRPYERVLIGIDVGGTFTDVVAAMSDGRLLLTKVPTTPADPSEGVIQGLHRILEMANAEPAQVERFIHGTTIATNAVIEQKGARTGLLMTDGFEDTLEIGRQKRSELYNLFIDPETPTFLAPRRLRVGIPERLDSQGAVLRPLDEGAVATAVRTLREREDVTSVAVCYLFSYLNPEHEQRTKALIEREFPEIAVSISSEIDPTFREYERALVTTFDAYVRPKVSSYLRAIARRLDEAAVPARLEVMQSQGGITTAESAIEKPVALLRSGPAAGVIAGQYVAAAVGEPNLITNDIGGTSADIALIVDGRPLVSTEGKIGKYPLRVPTIEVSSIGAGGGSIAWIDEVGGLHVGPRSAGSMPGPVAYGRGGTEPTVTDASLVLGYLNPHYFAAGDLELDVEAAHRAIETIGQQIGLSKLEAAAGIHTIINNRMADEIRLLTIARGHDPRDFALLVLGGAGAVHGGPLARALGVPKVIVPLSPGVLSAIGLLEANIEHDHALSFQRPAEAVLPEELVERFRQLDELGEERMERDRVPLEEVRVRRSADMRYLGQSYELEIDIDGEIDASVIERLVAAFHEAHQRVYKQHNRDAQVEFVNLRTVHYFPLPRPNVAPPPAGPSWTAAQVGTRRAYFGEIGDYVEVPVFRRQGLPTGQPKQGPFIVEQPDTTIVVFPDQVASRDEAGNLILEVG